MSDDRYVETTSKSWFGRIGNAFSGILFGLGLLVVGVVLLFWNEGRTVERRKALNEGAAIVKSISPQRVDPANEGALVHLTGDAVTEETLVDGDFGVQASAIRMRRKVEMFQWREEQETRTEKKLGGGETQTVTYTYSKTWSSSPIDSSRFKKPQGHENPAAPAYGSTSYAARNVKIGAFTLPPSLVGEMDAWRPLPLQAVPANLPAHLARQARLAGGGLYIGTSPNAPEIGDLRISFAIVPPSQVSLFAGQRGDSFAPYATRSGGQLERLDMGALSAEQMFAQTQRENTMLMWLLRGVGLLLLVIGFNLILRPISVFMDVVPFLGNLAGKGLFLVALLLALIVGLVVVAVAWLFYRPLFAGGLIAAAVLLLFALRRLRSKASGHTLGHTSGHTSGQSSTYSTPPPPPPPAPRS